MSKRSFFKGVSSWRAYFEEIEGSDGYREEENGGQLQFIQRGTGYPVVLIHGFPLTAAMWQPQIQSLSKFCRVICPHLPGFGKSPRQKLPSISGMAESVHQLLLELKIRKPVFLAGISMGSYVTLEFAKQFPKSVLGLGLLAAKAGGDSTEQKKIRRALAAKILKEGHAPLASGNLLKLFEKQGKSYAKTLISVKAMLDQNTPEGLADALFAMADREDMRTMIKNLRCPVLIAAGTKDAVIPFSESVAMHEAIPLARLQLIQNAGHLINLESPEMMNEMLTKFIRASIG